MQISKFSILRIIAFNVQRYGKNWCYMSQDKMLKILSSVYNVKIERRNLNYHLASLRDQGLIISIRRTHRNQNGTLCLLSTATCLTQEACKLLIKFGYQYFRKLYASIRKKYWKQTPPLSVQIKEDPRRNIDKISDDERQRLLNLFNKNFPKRIT